MDDGAMPAAYWFGLLANQGNDAAEYELGRCYYAGDGVERDVDKAFEWFVQAAQRDNANGMLWVGYFYHHGISVEQDYDMALQYYQAAKDHGHTYAQRRIDELLAERNS
ncbi:MAG: tetratricopeptide repeat protein [Christensenella sp.]|nr:tetratricopeptide repeat protein [Christensenella sp.]